MPDGTAAANPAFDVTPARLVSGLITERGIVAAEEGALRRLSETAAMTTNDPDLRDRASWPPCAGSTDWA